MSNPDVIYLPIEPLEERYTAQMLNWVTRALEEEGAYYRVILPDGYTSIQHGQWLDTYGTTIFRSKQLQMVAELFREGRIQNLTVFLLGDVWYPGVEALKFMAELSNKRVKVVGWHYAGTVDPADLLTRKLGRWGFEWERWLVSDYLDAVGVGSDYHRDNVRRIAGSTPVYSYGLAWRPRDVIAVAGTPKREKIVVFPHRWTKEKNPAAFVSAAHTLGDRGYRFVVSTNSTQGGIDIPASSNIELVRHASKEQYYRFLATCSIYYSAAEQETFGYALHEAIALGLGVVAPRRCSYPEMLHDDPRFLFDPEQDPYGINLLAAQMDKPTAPPLEWTMAYEGNEARFIRKVLKG
jgi:glycosyltransferase involved in cell wall biosynthesis